MGKRILYIISDIDKAVSFEWIASCFRDTYSHDLHFCFLLPAASATADWLVQQGFSCITFQLNGKKSWPSIFFSIYRLVNSLKPDIVHCHLLKASILGLSASYFARVPVRIFTRHHGSMHHTTHRKGLLWDRLCNSLASRIISISPITTEILCSWEKVNPDKIAYIPHGFSFQLFSDVTVDRVQRFRRTNSIPDSTFIIGVVSRFEHEKGVQYAVQAAISLVRQGFEIHLLLLNASGSYAGSIHALLQNLPPDTWTCLPFEPDIASAYASMNALVHVPISRYVEAFGQVYIEGLAMGIPLVCTLSGIASQVIADDFNGLVVPFNSSDAIASCLRRLMLDPSLQTKLSNNGPPSVRDAFSLQSMCSRLAELYSL